MSQDKSQLKITFDALYSKIKTHFENYKEHETAFNEMIEAHDTTVQKVLLRYLYARKLDVSKAFDLLIDTLKWRIEIRIKEITNERMKSIKVLKGSYICGFSERGDSICYIIPGAYNPHSAEERVNYLVHLMEEGSRRSLSKKMVWIMDFSQYSKRAKDPDSKKVAFDSVKVLQHHYPETLHSLFVVDAPWFFRALWYIVKPFIDPVTKKKVQFISRNESHLILKEVSDDMLDKNFGGSLEVTDEMKVDWDILQRQLELPKWIKLKEKLLEENNLFADLEEEKHE